jgi:hypothetical protein
MMIITTMFEKTEKNTLSSVGVWIVVHDLFAVSMAMNLSMNTFAAEERS